MPDYTAILTKIEDGVAAVGDHFWAAKQGLDAPTSTGIQARMRASAKPIS